MIVVDPCETREFLKEALSSSIFASPSMSKIPAGEEFPIQFISRRIFLSLPPHKSFLRKGLLSIYATYAKSAPAFRAIILARSNLDAWD